MEKRIFKGSKKVIKPIWKEYTLLKYEGRRVISREKIWIDESRIFPDDGDFSREPEE